MRTARPSLLLRAAVAGACVACGSFGSSPVAPGDADGGGAIDAGEAGVDVPPAGACTLSAAPSEVAQTTGAATKLQTNGESLFWIEGGTRLVRASLTDCRTTKLADGNISALAVDSNWIVWGDPYHALRRTDDVTMVVTHPTNVSPALLLAGGVSFWLDDAGISACDTPCITTTVASLATSAKLLATNGSKLFVFATDVAQGTSGSLYWRDASIAAAGIELMGPLAEKQDPISLVANDARVFWLNANGDVHGVPVSGAPSAASLPFVTGARVLAVDTSYVYVATASTIGRAPVGGGKLEPVVENETDIRSLLVTADAIVWSTATAVRRIQKTN